MIPREPRSHSRAFLSSRDTIDLIPSREFNLRLICISISRQQARSWLDAINDAEDIEIHRALVHLLSIIRYDIAQCRLSVSRGEINVRDIVKKKKKKKRKKENNDGHITRLIF